MKESKRVVVSYAAFTIRHHKSFVAKHVERDCILIGTKVFLMHTTIAEIVALFKLLNSAFKRNELQQFVLCNKSLCSIFQALCF